MTTLQGGIYTGGGTPLGFSENPLQGDLPGQVSAAPSPVYSTGATQYGGGGGTQIVSPTQNTNVSAYYNQPLNYTNNTSVAIPSIVGNSGSSGGSFLPAMTPIQPSFSTPAAANFAAPATFAQAQEAISRITPASMQSASAPSPSNGYIAAGQANTTSPLAMLQGIPQTPYANYAPGTDTNGGGPGGDPIPVVNYRQPQSVPLPAPQRPMYPMQGQMNGYGQPMPQGGPQMYPPQYGYGGGGGYGGGPQVPQGYTPQYQVPQYDPQQPPQSPQGQGGYGQPMQGQGQPGYWQQQAQNQQVPMQPNYRAYAGMIQAPRKSSAAGRFFDGIATSLNPEYAAQKKAEIGAREKFAEEYMKQRGDDYRSLKKDDSQMVTELAKQEMATRAAEATANATKKMTPSQGYELLSTAINTPIRTNEDMQRQAMLLDQAQEATGKDFSYWYGRTSSMSADAAKKTSGDLKQQELTNQEAAFRVSQQNNQAAQNREALQGARLGNTLKGNEVRNIPYTNMQQQGAANQAYANGAVAANPFVVAANTAKAINEGAASGQTLAMNQQQFNTNVQNQAAKPLEIGTRLMATYNMAQDQKSPEAQVLLRLAKQYLNQGNDGYGQVLTNQSNPSGPPIMPRQIQGRVAANPSGFVAPPPAVPVDRGTLPRMPAQIPGAPPPPQQVQQAPQPAPQRPVNPQPRTRMASDPLNADNIFNHDMVHAVQPAKIKGQSMTDMVAIKNLLDAYGYDDAGKEQARAEAMRLGYKIPKIR